MTKYTQNIKSVIKKADNCIQKIWDILTIPFVFIFVVMAIMILTSCDNGDGYSGKYLCTDKYGLVRSHTSHTYEFNYMVGDLVSCKLYLEEDILLAKKHGTPLELDLDAYRKALNEKKKLRCTNEYC